MATATDGQELAGGLRLDPRSIRSLRLFSTEPGAPRTRRPTDWILLVVGLFALLLSSGSAEPPGSLSDDITQLVLDTPVWILSLWELLSGVMIAWAGLLVLLALVRAHFLSVAASAASVLVGLALAYLAQRIAIEEPLDIGDFLHRFTSEGLATFPGIRLVIASAVLVVMSPAVSRPFRFLGRIVLLLGFFATVGLGASTFVGAIGGLAAGTTAAAVVHLVIGSPGGRPARAEVRRVLAELGVPVEDLQPASLEPEGVVVMDATHADGRPLSVKVYGRDAWDGQLINKFWRYLWYRDSHSTLLLSRFHQVEHEALMTLTAERAGAPVPELLVAAQTGGRDAAMVTTAGGRPLASLADEGSVADRPMVELWAALERVHRSGIVHGGLDLHTATITDGGTPLVTDWSAAFAAVTDDDVDAERAQLLVLSALVVGPERAIEITRNAVGSGELARLVPYVQTPALTNGLRRDLREHDLDVDALRDMAAEVVDVEQVELIELRRITVKSVASIVLVGLAAMLLISSLSDIGIDTIVDELSDATWGWVLIALVVAQLARLWSAVGTTGATNHPLRLGPTVVLEFAITFVNLVVPSTAARIATKMRYFQRAGMTLTSATAMSGIDAVAGFIVQTTILLSAILFGLGGLDFELDIDTDTVQRLAAIFGIVLIVVLVVFTLAIAFIPDVRQKIMGPVREFRTAFRVVRAPTRLLRLFGGNAMAELTFASVLGFSLLAFGESAPIISLLVINVGVALLAGIMPIPGGVGVTEAAFTAGLVAIGIPEPTAFATAITTRLCTFYLPPIWGYFAMRWLRENKYL